jgi:hypothetical protein
VELPLRQPGQPLGSKSLEDFIPIMGLKTCKRLVERDTKEWFDIWCYHRSISDPPTAGFLTHLTGGKSLPEQ